MYSCIVGDLTVTISGLSSVGLPGQTAQYDIYLYGFGGTETIDDVQYCLNAQFTINPPSPVQGAQQPTDEFYGGWINTWTEGGQYVLFSSVPVTTPGQTITITVAPDPNIPVGEWFMNGIQIVPVY